MGTAAHVQLRDLKVPVHFVTPRDRWHFLAIGAWAVAMAAFMSLDETGPQRVWGYPLWALLLGLGGLATLVFTIRMASFQLRGLAAAAMVVGCTGRGFGMVLAVLNRTDANSVWAAALGMGAWTMLGFLLYFTWRSRVPVPGGAAHDPFGG